MRRGILFLLIFVLSPFVFAQSLEISVGLSPAGSFKAQTSKVKGEAMVNGDSVFADKVLVDLRSLNSGISLRDKHLKDRLQVDKYPLAKLVKAQGQGGQGTATLELKGQKVNVEGTYKVQGKVLKAEFKMKMSVLNITDARYMGVGAKDEVTVLITLPVKN